MTKLWLAASVLFLALGHVSYAQDDVELRFGSELPPELETLMERGANYLVNSQNEDGSWSARNKFQSNGTGITALGVLALLSTGEDPNFGKYAPNIRRGLVFLIKEQNPVTGMPGGNSYDFSFSMLVFAEAYGVVDDDLLFAEKGVAGSRTIGEALELCVKAACSIADEPKLRGRAWSSTVAHGNGRPDASTGGSLLVSVLAARNAGVEIPDAVIEKALLFFRESTKADGGVRYFKGWGSSYGNSVARSSIASLVMAIAKRKQWSEYESTRRYLLSTIEQPYDLHPHYADYYRAQALFQADFESWQAWNRERIRSTAKQVNDDGSIGQSSVGASYATAMSMLTLAVNYRFLPIYER